MKETSQAIVSVKREVELAEWQRQIRFYEAPDAEQLKVILGTLVDANKPVC